LASFQVENDRDTDENGPQQWEQRSAATFGPREPSPAPSSDKGDDSDLEYEPTQQEDPGLEVIQEGLLFTRINSNKSQIFADLDFFIPFPVPEEGCTIGRASSNDRMLPLDEDRVLRQVYQFTSNRHAVFSSCASGIFLSDHSTTGTFVGDQHASKLVPSIAQGTLPSCQSERFGPLRVGQTIFFGANNEQPTSSSRPLPYHGVAFLVSKAVGRCGSGVCTNKNKNKRKASSADEDPEPTASSDAPRPSEAATLAQKLENKPADERVRILGAALKRAKREVHQDLDAPAAEARSGHHVSANAAARAESSAQGSRERGAAAKEQRFQTHAKKSGKPGQQRQQQHHKRVLLKKIKGAPAGRRKATTHTITLDGGGGGGGGGGGQRGHYGDGGGSGGSSGKGHGGKGGGGKGFGSGKGGGDGKGVRGGKGVRSGKGIHGGKGFGDSKGGDGGGKGRGKGKGRRSSGFRNYGHRD